MSADEQIQALLPPHISSNAVSRASAGVGSCPWVKVHWAGAGVAGVPRSLFFVIYRITTFYFTCMQTVLSPIRNTSPSRFVVREKVHLGLSKVTLLTLTSNLYTKCTILNEKSYYNGKKFIMNLVMSNLCCQSI